MMNKQAEMYTKEENIFLSSSEKKILYFSDGTLEMDEAEDTVTSEVDSTPLTLVSKDLTWLPWICNKSIAVGSKALEVCDYVGESLASFFGITTPKYQFEINEYMRINEEKEKSNISIELRSWTINDDSSQNTNSLYSAKQKTSR